MSERDPVVARQPEALWRRAYPNRVLVLPPGAEEPVLLEGTAASIWELLEEPCSADELGRALSDVYGADEALVAADLAPAVDDLTARRVLERRDH